MSESPACPHCGKAHFTYSGKPRSSCDICLRVHRPEDVCFIVIELGDVIDEAEANALDANGYRLIKVFPRLLDRYKRCQFVKFNGWPEGPMDGERDRAYTAHEHYVDARRRRKVQP